MSAQVIHNLRVTRGNEVLAYTTVTKDICTAQFDPTRVPSNPDTSFPHLDESDRVIVAALE
jgi:hypothetical protein